MEYNLDLKWTIPQREVFFETKEKIIVVPKGRRTGITHGGAQAFIVYALDGISPMLWGDTINGNIDRYYKRFFLPVLKKLPLEVSWEWSSDKRVLTINDSIIDFRSADRPENWEGFGYKKIFLNEAGIILADSSLYEDSVTPMLWDYVDSQIIIAGSPKGKFKKNGEKHKFYELYEIAKSGLDPDYKLLQYSTFTNPFLNTEIIENQKKKYMMLGYHHYLQNVEGEFIDEIIGGSPFMSSYDPARHESLEAVYNPHRQTLVSIDFNLDPFTAVFAQMWRDKDGEHLHIFDEVQIEGGSIPVMIDYLINKEFDYPGYLRNVIITGDSMGKGRDISQRDLASHYHKIQRGLRLKWSQFWLPNNPKHSNSRVDCNEVLTYFPDLKINPAKCPQTARDMKIVQCDNHHKILKSNRNLSEQKADFLDNFRYIVNTFLKKWIETREKIEESQRRKEKLLQ